MVATRSAWQPLPKGRSFHAVRCATQQPVRGHTFCIKPVREGRQQPVRGSDTFCNRPEREQGQGQFFVYACAQARATDVPYVRNSVFYLPHPIHRCCSIYSRLVATRCLSILRALSCRKQKHKTLTESAESKMSCMQFAHTMCISARAFGTCISEQPTSGYCRDWCLVFAPALLGEMEGKNFVPAEFDSRREASAGGRDGHRLTSQPTLASTYQDCCGVLAR